MAIPKAPLFGFGASGQLGKAIVFSSWKGIDVAREYVVPANPKSSAQVVQRGYFDVAVSEWQEFKTESNALDRAAWNRFAGVLTRMSGFNAFVRNFVNQRVAGNTPVGFFKNLAVTDTLANSFDANVAVDNGGTQQVTLWIGLTKTFFINWISVAMVAGVATFANQNLSTSFPAGSTIYFYFTVPSAPGGTDRSGLYTTKLT